MWTASLFLVEGSALDLEGKATGCGAVHLDVVDIGMREETFNCGFKFAVRDEFACDQMATVRVSLESARAGAKLFGESCVGRVTWAFVGVDVDRAGLREVLFDARETIIREEDALIDSWAEGTKAVAARCFVGRELLVDGEAVARRAHGFTDGFSHFRRNR